MADRRSRALCLRGGKVYTMDAERPIAEAVAVRDGRIAAVGAWADVAPFSGGVPVHHLRGCTVLPGFIDSHAHLTWTGLQETALDFSGTEGVDDVADILRPAVSDAPQGGLVFGMGINHYLFPERRLPSREDLDAVAPHHPVFILGITGHYSLANTRCLRELALPAGTTGLGSDGHLRDRANTLAEAGIRVRFSREQGVSKLHRAAARQAVSVGLTTVHALEGGEQSDDQTVLSLLNALPELPVRVVVWYETLNVDAVLKLGLPRIGGCILLDGDFGPHTAALLEPYHDQPHSKGTLYYTQEEVDAFVMAAHGAGLQIALHAVGDRAAEQALNAYERALAAIPRPDHRHRIEHFEIYDPKLVQRALGLGVHLAIQPPFNGYFGGHARLNPLLGEERALLSDPVCSLIEAGVPVGGGSDSTVTPLNPLYGVHCAVNHSIRSERLNARRALQLYTLDNAYLGHEEADTGSIEVGKLGDLVVLGADPTEVDPATIADIPVEMTIVEGVPVYMRAPAS